MSGFDKLLCPLRFVVFRNGAAGGLEKVNITQNMPEFRWCMNLTQCGDVLCFRSCMTAVLLKKQRMKMLSFMFCSILELL